MHLQTGRKLTKQYFLRLFAIVLAFALPATGVALGSSGENGLVRVRLSSLGTLNTLTMNLHGFYTANNGQISLPSGTQVTVSCNAATGQLTLSASAQSWKMGEYFTLNRSASDDSVTIAQAGSNPYPADFSFRSAKNSSGYILLPVAHIQMEDYLYGVLPYEMGNSAPLEALKAQAVAARTYTIRMMEKRAGSTYDVVDTTADQLYKGTPAGNMNCKAAVDATAGVVLKYGDRYAETYYCSSNGGQTESAQNIWGGKGYHYLPVTDDPYDLASGSAKTKTTTIYKDLQHGSNRQTFMQILKEKTVSCLKRNGYASTMANTQLIWLEKLTLHTPKFAAPSKLYTKADFTVSVETTAGGGGTVNTSVVVTADVFDELESLLGLNVQSSSNEIWTVTSNDTAYTLKAGRYGHGVGMSQYGAMEMARQGFGYDDILGFYYPGCATVIMHFADRPMEDAGSGVSPEILPSATDSSGNMENPNESQNELGYATVQANGFVNLRQSPSLNAPIVGIALEGERVKVLFLENQWAFVQYNGVQAYAMKKLLSDVYQMESVPEQNDQFTGESMPSIDAPTALSSSGDAKQAMIFCTDGFVNFRETPSLSGRVLMQLPHGTYLNVVQSEGEFSRVSYLGIEGYVMNAFLVHGDPFGQISSTTPPQPMVTAEPPQANEIPTPASTPQPTVHPEVSKENYRIATVTTQRGSLNLREEPRDNAYILAQIPQYTQIEAYVLNNNWCKVCYNGLEGYAMNQFITFADTPQPVPTPEGSIQRPIAAVGQAKVTTQRGSLNLRMTPSSSGAVLQTIPQGETVMVHSFDKEWAMVSYREYSGYVMMAYLTMSNDAFEQPENMLPDSWNAQGTPPPVTTRTPDRPDAHPSSGDTAKMKELPEGYVPLEQMIAVAGAGNTDFRALPSLNERVLHSIPASERFEVFACSDEWCIGVWKKVVGYVRLSEVTLYASNELP